MIVQSHPILLSLCGDSLQLQFFRNMFEKADPASWQVVMMGVFLVLLVAGLVVWELFRKRRVQLAKMRRQWDNFQIQAKTMGLSEADISLLKEIYQCLEALHSPDAMLRIPASYDRALDAWLSTRSGKITPSDWERLGAIRVRLGFKGLAPEMSLSHTRQIAEAQDVRMASEGSQFASSGKVMVNQEDALIVGIPSLETISVGMRVRVAFSRQGDGEYKAVLQVARIDQENGLLHLEHTDQLTRQQLRMWVRVPVMISGLMKRVMDPEGTPHPVQSFEVTLLDLSGGGAMVSSVEMVEVESRGVLDFQLGETRLEGVRFVMLRTGRTSRNGRQVCHLCFESIDVQTQERIMRYVFERQRTVRGVA